MYLKYFDEEDAQSALVGLNGRFYAGRTLTVDSSEKTCFKCFPLVLESLKMPTVPSLLSSAPQ